MTDKKFGNPKGNPGNQPKKGSSYFIEPIKSIKDIQRIEKMLRDEPRNHLLFVMGINNGVRVGDLLKLKVSDVRGIKPGEKIRIKEGKTGKHNFIGITDSIYKSLNAYLKIVKNDTDYLFRSRKGANRPLTTTAVNNLIKKWTDFIKLKGSFGAHTLRKTWAYQKRMQGISWEIICKRLNHSNLAVTMRYLGIENKEVEDSVLMNEII